MATEAFLGFNAFNTREITGKDVIDFISFRRRMVEGDPFDEEFMAAVFPRALRLLATPYPTPGARMALVPSI
ncbi:hypothetical protein MYX75_06955 [Acidobacteria bacterium AH-259-A15]|nr:hypothetical protein [Acidobacteria bacterium AH-259-A15]